MARLPAVSCDAKAYVNMVAMAGNNGSSAATYFGRQMKAERIAHGWTLRELAARTGIDFATLSRIENGKRPPTEKLATACDTVFPERRGWFLDYFEESKSWVPAGFRSWGEYEDRAVTVRSWTPGVVDGLLQTEAYARALLETSGAADEVVSARLDARMARQQRVLYRGEPPLTWFVVDELSLYRRVGTAEVMAGQLRNLADVARLGHVTLQVLPAVAHPATQGSFVVTDVAAYAEHSFGGYTFTEPETVTAALRLFANIGAESNKASESLATIEGLADLWRTGEPRATAARTAASA
jgi:DNA-binding XRE family transcriptional regulator